MSMKTNIVLLLVIVLGTFLPGCVIYTEDPWDGSDASSSHKDVQVDFNDPVLNRRQVLLFGMINQRAAELAIQKLLYLDGKSHEPIDLYLQTPGGEMKHAMAIEQTIRTLQSPVNTYALSECNSGGALLLAAGTGRRRAFHGALVMVHGIVVKGKPPQGLTQQVQDGYTEFWRKHARLPEAWLPLPRDSKHILTAEQALQYGVVDEVINK